MSARIDTPSAHTLPQPEEAGGWTVSESIGAIGEGHPETEALDQVVARLARLAPLEYDRVREVEATGLGVRVKTLDAEVRKARRAPSLRSEAEAGSASSLDDPEPWSDPVDGGALIDEIVGVVRRYLILPTGAAETIALWTLHAHLHDTAAISPILAITSPSPECGKTTLLDLLGSLVPRPLPASNITAAALFRAVEMWQPTMLVDEADTFLSNSDELRGVLNSGHRRSAAFVIRTVGDDHEPRQFRTWAAKAIALIGKLPDTLASRSIQIELRRKIASERVDALRGDRLGHLEPLRRRCARYALDWADSLGRADPRMPPALHGRHADNWRHLIAIADTAGGDWPDRVRQVALTAAATRTEQTAAIMLLDDLRTLFAERRIDRITSTDIVQALGKMEDRPWSEWKAGMPITVRQLARLLEPFKVTPIKFRVPGKTPGTRGYEQTAFADAFVRYLPELPFQSATAPQANETAISDEHHPPQPVSAVADRTKPNAKDANACGVVADGRAVASHQVVLHERAAMPEHETGLARKEAEGHAAARISSNGSDH